MFIYLQVLVAFLLAAGSPRQESDPKLDHPAPLEPKIAAASDEAKRTMATFRYPENLTVNLFAAEPSVANPVAIDVDPVGRVFVCETFRQELGVEDNREHPEWLQDDLAAQTVQDRVNYIRKHEPNIKKEYHDQDDRIRLLYDSDGDGVAESSTVFSHGYNGIAEGTGAGVLAVGDDVYYTNIPNLWLLNDFNSDGVADKKTCLQSGFGVRFAFRGHDLHGLLVGPDRRLYFSIGDRGYNVSPDIKDPASGAVFSCKLDGSDLQVFATGLRNPQELAFDDYGNLFTGDNNSDSGDKARWVYVVPGGDSGWRMHYQYLPDRGPFNREKIWHPFNSDTPAYIVPPIDNLADGPGGLAFYPGTGLTEHFRSRFVLCDFRGTANASGIRTFRLKPRGAGFEIVDSEKTIWNTLATDVAFGPDGKLYVSDWVFGWQGVGKGRIYTYESTHPNENLVTEVQSILRAGLNDATDERLVQLIGHIDRRVRYAAQFALVDRKKTKLLLNAFVLAGEDEILKAIHGMWGFTMLASQPEELQALSENDHRKLAIFIENCANDELQAQTAKMIGLAPELNLTNELERFIQSEKPRVRYMAALSIAKIGTSRHLDLLLQLLTDNADIDAFIRHAGIMGLVGILDRMTNTQRNRTVSVFERHSSRSVRLACVVALRKLKSPLLVNFLADRDNGIVLETARAIYDLPLGHRATSRLAKLIQKDAKSDALARRVINANSQVGTTQSAEALARFAMNRAENLERRIDAIRLLGSWRNPHPIDEVTGAWRPVKNDNRDLGAADKALTQCVDQGLADNDIVDAFLAACLANQTTVPITRLRELLAASSDPDVQTVALLAIKQNDYLLYQQVLTEKLDRPAELPTAWLKFLDDVEPQAVFDFVETTLAFPCPIDRKRQAIQLLGRFANQPRAEKLILGLLAELKNESVDKLLQLDVLLAAQNFDSPATQAQLVSVYEEESKFRIPYRYVLNGGDSENGKKLFYERTELSCLRCHVIGSSGGNVGPELTGIGLTKTREYILAAIVEPNQTISAGYNESIILTDEGSVLTGIKKSEDDDSITLLDKDGVLIRVAKEVIEDEKVGQSSMPEDLINKLTILELRDLVEFLATQTSKKRSSAQPVGH